MFSLGEALRRRPWILCGLLLLYGACVAHFLVSPWNYIPEDMLPNIDLIYMSVRMKFTETFISQILNQGRVILNSFPDHGPSYFWYTAVIGVLTNKLEAWQVFLFVQMLAAAFVISIYPLMTYRWMDSIACALVSPWLVGAFAGDILYENKTDTYWALAWIVVVSIPLLSIFWEEKRGAVKWAAFSLLLLGMGIANSPRSHASLPLLLILFAVVAWQTKEATDGPDRFTSVKNRLLWGRCVLLLVSLFLGYRLFTNIIPEIYAFFTNQETLESWGPWHNVIVGLGWEKNPFGFYYSDTSAYELAQRVNHDVIYGSREYAEILKQEFLRLWREEPLYMLETYTRKMFACVHRLGIEQLAGILLVTAGWLRYGKGYEDIYRVAAPALIFLVVCAVVMLVHPMIMTPQVGAYIFGFAASVRLILLVLIFAMIRQFIDMLKRLVTSQERNNLKF